MFLSACKTLGRYNIQIFLSDFINIIKYLLSINKTLKKNKIVRNNINLLEYHNNLIDSKRI